MAGNTHLKVWAERVTKAWGSFSGKRQPERLAQVLNTSQSTEGAATGVTRGLSPRHLPPTNFGFRSVGSLPLASLLKALHNKSSCLQVNTALWPEMARGGHASGMVGTLAD